MHRAVVCVAAAVLALGGCSVGEDRSRETRDSRAAPHLGGDPGRLADLPARPMDRLERTVRERLASGLLAHGVEVDYVECPRWRAPEVHVVWCVGYFDGVRGDVRVALHRAPHGTVGFDARLARGVVATRTLIDRLEQAGYTDVDCGGRPTYPAEAGARIVCAVTESGRRSHVVATVTDRSGAVEIRDY